MGFRLVIGYIGLLELVTTSNYNRFASSNTLQFTIACAKSSITSLCTAMQRLPRRGTPPPTPLLRGDYLTATSDSDRQSVRDTLRLAVYHHSVRLGAKPLEPACRLP
jgi:hypothetical protein